MLLSYIERAKLNTPDKANLSPQILMIRSYLDKFNAETIIATILIDIYLLRDIYLPSCLPWRERFSPKVILLIQKFKNFCLITFFKNR